MLKDSICQIISYPGKCDNDHDTSSGSGKIEVSNWCKLRLLGCAAVHLSPRRGVAEHSSNRMRSDTAGFQNINSWGFTDLRTVLNAKVVFQTMIDHSVRIPGGKRSMKVPLRDLMSKSRINLSENKQRSCGRMQLQGRSPSCTSRQNVGP